MKFRKKPVEVEAWPIKELVYDYSNLRMMPPPVANGVVAGTLKFVGNGVHVTTLEGGMFGRLEDILIMGVAGEFYPCKPEIFAASYEPVST